MESIELYRVGAEEYAEDLLEVFQLSVSKHRHVGKLPEVEKNCPKELEETISSSRRAGRKSNFIQSE